MKKRPLTKLKHGFLLLAVLSSGALKAQLCLNPSVTYLTSGNSPNTLGVGDFNNDGIPDMISSNAGSSSLTYLQGTGTGTFAAGVTVLSSVTPKNIVVGDWNGDNNLDLAFTVGNNQFGISLGNGNGTFNAVTYYSSGGSGTLAIKSADFNADGFKDLVITNFDSNNFSIMLGTGTGTFGSATNFGNPPEPTGITIADFNNDGDPDIGVTNGWFSYVLVYLGSTGATFTSAPTLSTGNKPYYLCSADFNGDNNIDLAVPNQNDGNVSVFMGNGAGGFSARVNYTTGGSPTRVEACDLNLDGFPDLAVRKNSASNITVLLGTGTGTFGAATDYTLGTSTSDFICADFNLDQKPDLAATLNSTNRIGVLLNCSTRNGAMLDFDGVDDVVTGTAPNLQNTDFTIEFWAKRRNTATTQGLFLIGTDGINNNAIFMYLPVTGGVSFGFWGNDLYVGAGLYLDLNWHHYALTYNTTTNQRIIYRDGVQIGTDISPTDFVGNTNFMIGQFGGHSRTNGQIDEFRIWNRVLCQSEIQNNRNCEIPSSGAGLQANYHFNQGVAEIANPAVTTLTDVSGFNRNCTLSGFALSGNTSNWGAPGAVASGSTCGTFVPSAVSFSGTSKTNISCFGAANGTASVVAIGSDLTYNWTPGNPTGDGSASVTGLTAGTWTCTVTNSCGGTGIQTFIITEPSALATSALFQTNVSCKGGSNGAASVSVSGGTTAYSYNWTPGNPAGDGTTSVTGLTAGAWTCTVTDVNSCATSQVFNISQPNALVATSSQTNVTCSGGNNGSASVTVSGGTAGYTYNWSPGNPTGDGTASVTGLINLLATPWTCTITDANSCVTTKDFYISEPTPLVTNFSSQTNVSCNGGSTGAASVTVSGGTTAYSYNWTPGNPAGDGTASVTGLTSGTWTCTVTDANNCSSARVFNITQPTALITSSLSQTNVSCNGGLNGAASVSVSGGTTAYSYNWTPGNPAGDGTTSVTGLSAGAWTCTVTDANSCTSAQMFNITQPAQLTDYGVTAATSAFCGNNSTTITTSGSTLGVNYYLRNGSTVVAGPITGTGSPLNFNTGTISTTTTYNVFAETPGSKGLSFDGTANKYVDPNILSSLANNFTIQAWINPTATHEIDAQTTGGAGGAGGQKYVLWPTYRNPGDAGVGISAGTNGVSVYEHSSGHMPPLLVWSGTITGWTHIAVVMTNKTPTLYINGVLVATGVTSTRTNCYVSLGAGNAQFPSQFGGIGGGSYGGFVGTIDEFRIYNTPLNAAQISGNMNTCLLGNEANLYASYNFNEGLGTIADDISPNNFNGTLTNMLPTQWVNGVVNCSPVCSFQMTQTASVTINPVPSASSSATTIACNGGSATVTVLASGGTAPYSGTGNYSELAGTYSYTVTDLNSCTSTTNVSITQPSALASSSSATAIACNGGNATVTVLASGGTAPYSGTGNYTELAGTYSYTVTDANSCTNTTNISITEPNALIASSSATPIACNGGNATVTVLASGGTAPYSGTGNYTELAGNYSYTVTDANSCTNTINITISEPATLSTSTSNTNVDCNGNSNGSIDLTVSGGTTPYSFDWNSGTFSTEDLSGLAPGTYIGLITDLNGCTDGGTITITEPPVLVATATTLVDPSTCGGTNGSIDLSVAGGTTDYTYLWSNSSMNEDLAGVTEGAYTCVITDANGCTANINGTLNDPSAPTVTLVFAVDTLCSIDAAITLGGQSPAGGTFSGLGVIGNTFDPSVAGVGVHTITYTFTDGNACTASTTDLMTVQNCTSIEDLSLESPIAIYPNPNSGIFTLQLTSATSAEVTIYDAQGRLVHTQNMETNVQTQMSILDSGMYMINVLTADGQSTSQRMIVTK